MSSDLRTEVERILTELKQQGFRVRSGKHWVIYPPDKAKRAMAMPRSPSDWRGILNLRRDLRKLGYKDPKRGN